MRFCFWVQTTISNTIFKQNPFYWSCDVFDFLRINEKVKCFISFSREVRMSQGALSMHHLHAERSCPTSVRAQKYEMIHKWEWPQYIQHPFYYCKTAHRLNTATKTQASERGMSFLSTSDWFWMTSDSQHRLKSAAIILTVYQFSLEQKRPAHCINMKYITFETCLMSSM